MAIVGVGKVDDRDERLVPGDHRVRQGEMHELACAFESALVEVGPIGAEVAEGLVEDLVRPTSAVETGERQPNEEVAQAVAVEHVRVENGLEAAAPGEDGILSSRAQAPASGA